jgi:hypothetical protein
MELMIVPPDHRKLVILKPVEKLIVARQTRRLDLSSRPIGAEMLAGAKSARALADAQFTNKSLSDE